MIYPRYVFLLLAGYIAFFSVTAPTQGQEIDEGERAALQRVMDATREGDYSSYIKTISAHNFLEISIDLLGTQVYQSHHTTREGQLTVASVDPYVLSGTYFINSSMLNDELGVQEMLGYTLEAAIMVEDDLLTLDAAFTDLDDPDNLLTALPDGPVDYAPGDPLPAVLADLDLEQYLSDAVTAEPMPSSIAVFQDVAAMLESLHALEDIAEAVSIAPDVVDGAEVDVIAVRFRFGRLLDLLADQNLIVFAPESLEAAVFEALRDVDVLAEYALNASDQIVQWDLILQGEIAGLPLDPAMLGLEDALRGSVITLSINLDERTTITYSHINDVVANTAATP